MNAQPDAHLRGSWLMLARVIWVTLSVLAVGLYIVSVVINIRQPLPICTTPGAECDPLDLSAEDVEWIEAHGFPVELYTGFLFVFDLIFNLSFILVAIFIFWRKADDWMALLFSLTLLLLGASGFSTANELLIELLPGWRWAVEIINQLPYLGLFLIIYLFPNGQFAPRWVGYMAIPLLALLLVGTTTIPFSILQWVLWPNFGFALYSMIYRFRYVSGPQERQQTKWVAFGLSAVLVLTAMWAVGMIFFSPEQPSLARTYFVVILHPVVSIIGTLLPICVAISILRYRLWEIDLIIRRTLQYTLLTGLLALIYFGGIITLQGIVGPLTGQENSPLVTVITTLAIAALFNPLRHRVQDFIDRSFYRKKYNAEQSLAQFAAVARDEVDMDKLTAALIEVVQETVQPEHVSLWLTGDRLHHQIIRQSTDHQ